MKADHEPAALLRRRCPDKQPADCRDDQLETAAPFDLARFFGST